MPGWQKTADDRKRDAAVYDTEYRRNRPKAMRRDRWRCQLRLPGCRGAASQCDHKTPVSQGGTNDMSNLHAVCDSCHGKKTAQEGGGFRAGQAADPQPTPRTAW